MSDMTPTSKDGKKAMFIREDLSSGEPHNSFIVTGSGNIVDDHLTQNLPGGKKLTTKSW